MSDRIRIQRRKQISDSYSYPQLATDTSGLRMGTTQTSVIHEISRISLRPQAQLTVSQPGDFYEQEADRVAQQVMGMGDRTNHNAIQRETSPQEEEENLQLKSLGNTITPLVQREEIPQEEEEENLQMKSLGNFAIQREEIPKEEEEEEEEIQTKQSPTANSQLSTASLENRLSSSHGGGNPLSDEVRSFMEPRFGTDFSGVRVHTGSEAVQMNQDVNAQAFTHGQDIYFGAGKSPGKDALTAHELTHVVQQTGTQESNLATDRIQKESDSEVNLNENSTNSSKPEADPSSPEVPPELAGKTIQVSIELPPPAPIEVPLADVKPSPEYIDTPDTPLSDSDTVMAKLLPGIIQRDDDNDKPGVGIDFATNSFSFTATALYRNCNLYKFKNLLGQDNSLEIGFIPQFQWSYDGQKAAYQVGIPMLNQHIQLFRGNVISELEAGISSVLTTSSIGGQAQLQLHLLKLGEISVLGTGSLTYTREERTGKLEPDGNIGTQISITF